MTFADELAATNDSLSASILMLLRQDAILRLARAAQDASDSARIVVNARATDREALPMIVMPEGVIADLRAALRELNGEKP